MSSRRRRRPRENLAKNQPTNHRLILNKLGYPSRSKGRAELLKSIHTFRESYVSPEGRHGPDLLRFQHEEPMLREMAQSYLSHDTNGPRYWPDNNDPGADDKLTYSQNEAKIALLLKQLFWRLNITGQRSFADKRRKARKVLNEQGGRTDPVLLDEIDLSYTQPRWSTPRQAFGPENRSSFTNFTFAAKAEHTEAPNVPLSSVPPFAQDGTGQHSVPQDDTLGQNAPTDDARANNVTERAVNEGAFTAGNPNRRPEAVMSTAAVETEFRSFNNTRMSPRNRKRPQDPMYVYEESFGDYMLSPSLSHDGSSSESEASSINDSHDQIGENKPESMDIPGGFAGAPNGEPTEDQNIEQVARELWRGVNLDQHNSDTGQHNPVAHTAPPDPVQANGSQNSELDEELHLQTNHGTNPGEAGAVPPHPTPPPTPLPEVRFVYQLILSRDGAYVETVLWQPNIPVLAMTWPQLEASLPAQLITTSDVLLIRICGFQKTEGAQVEVRHGDEINLDLSMKTLYAKVEKFIDEFDHLARIDLTVEIEAKTPLISGPPLATREQGSHWF